MCKREPERSEGGHSQKIVPGLEAFNHVRNVKPGPERSEGPLSKDRARTGHSQKGVLTKHRTLNLKRLTSGRSVNANPNEVRVRARTGSINRWLGCQART